MIHPAFLSPVEVEILDDELFRVVRPVRYQSAAMPAIIVVPEGFVTDGSSVPRLPIVYWLYGGRARKAAIIHDFLYQTHICPKAIADAVFLEAMVLIPNLPGWARRAMHKGVVLGGQSSYDSGPRRYTIFGNAERAGEM